MALMLCVVSIVVIIAYFTNRNYTDPAIRLDISLNECVCVWFCSFIHSLFIHFWMYECEWMRFDIYIIGISNELKKERTKSFLFFELKMGMRIWSIWQFVFSINDVCFTVLLYYVLFCSVSDSRWIGEKYGTGMKWTPCNMSNHHQMKIYVTFRLKYSILLNQYIFRIDTHESLLLSSRAIQTNGMFYLNSSCFFYFVFFFASVQFVSLLYLKL